MDLIKREDLNKEFLPGRVIQKAVGKDAPNVSGKMTMGFARYSDESGPMDPHHHAEEIVYVLSAKDGWARNTTYLITINAIAKAQNGLGLAEDYVFDIQTLPSHFRLLQSQRKMVWKWE